MQQLVIPGQGEKQKRWVFQIKSHASRLIAFHECGHAKASRLFWTKDEIFAALVPIWRSKIRWGKASETYVRQGAIPDGMAAASEIGELIGSHGRRLLPALGGRQATAIDSRIVEVACVLRRQPDKLRHKTKKQAARSHGFKQGRAYRVIAFAAIVKSKQDSRLGPVWRRQGALPETEEVSGEMNVKCLAAHSSWRRNWPASR